MSRPRLSDREYAAIEACMRARGVSRARVVGLAKESFTHHMAATASDGTAASPTTVAWFLQRVDTEWARDEGARIASFNRVAAEAVSTAPVASSR